MKKNSIILFRLLLILYLGTVAFLCFGHFENTPDIPLTIMGISTDKIAHFLMFFPASILMYLAHGQYFRNWRQRLLFVLCASSIGSILAWGTELIQGIIVYRTKDSMDFVADIMAIAVSGVAIFIFDTIFTSRCRQC